MASSSLHVEGRCLKWARVSFLPTELLRNLIYFSPNTALRSSPIWRQSPRVDKLEQIYHVFYGQRTLQLLRSLELSGQREWTTLRVSYWHIDLTGFASRQSSIRCCSTLLWAFFATLRPTRPPLRHPHWINHLRTHIRNYWLLPQLPYQLRDNSTLDPHLRHKLKLNAKATGSQELVSWP